MKNLVKISETWGNGNKQLETTYRKDGTIKYISDYNSYGKLNTRTFYSKDQKERKRYFDGKISEKMIYYDNGNLKAYYDYLYRNDEDHPYKIEYYNEDGTIKRRLYYYEDHPDKLKWKQAFFKNHPTIGGMDIEYNLDGFKCARLIYDKNGDIIKNRSMVRYYTCDNMDNCMLEEY